MCMCVRGARGQQCHSTAQNPQSSFAGAQCPTHFPRERVLGHPLACRAVPPITTPSPPHRAGQPGCTSRARSRALVRARARHSWVNVVEEKVPLHRYFVRKMSVLGSIPASKVDEALASDDNASGATPTRPRGMPGLLDTSTDSTSSPVRYHAHHRHPHGHAQPSQRARHIFKTPPGLIKGDGKFDPERYGLVEDLLLDPEFVLAAEHGRGLLQFLLDNAHGTHETIFTDRLESSDLGRMHRLSQGAKALLGSLFYRTLCGTRGFIFGLEHSLPSAVAAAVRNTMRFDTRWNAPSPSFPLDDFALTHDVRHADELFKATLLDTASFAERELKLGLSGFCALRRCLDLAVVIDLVPGHVTRGFVNHAMRAHRPVARVVAQIACVLKPCYAPVFTGTGGMPRREPHGLYVSAAAMDHRRVALEWHRQLLKCMRRLGHLEKETFTREQAQSAAQRVLGLVLIDASSSSPWRFTSFMQMALDDLETCTAERVQPIDADAPKTRGGHPKEKWPHYWFRYHYAWDFIKGLLSALEGSIFNLVEFREWRLRISTLLLEYFSQVSSRHAGKVDLIGTLELMYAPVVFRLYALRLEDMPASMITERQKLCEIVGQNVFTSGRDPRPMFASLYMRVAATEAQFARRDTDYSPSKRLCRASSLGSRTTVAPLVTMTTTSTSSSSSSSSSSSTTTSPRVSALSGAPGASAVLERDSVPGYSIPGAPRAKKWASPADPECACNVEHFALGHYGVNGWGAGCATENWWWRAVFWVLLFDEIWDVGDNFANGILNDFQSFPLDHYNVGGRVLVSVIDAVACSRFALVCFRMVLG